MKRYTMPGTDLTVSKLCFGTMTCGGQTPDDESIELIEAALADGYNFFDTADSYNQGQAEIITGKALAGKRSAVVLASKVYYPVSDADDKGLSPARMRSHLEASLRRLNTEYLDLYYLHQPDYDTPIEETLKQLDAFIKQGKIRYYGVSNYAAWQIADIFALSEKLGIAPPVVTQNVYNILTRGIEAELVPFCQSRKMPIMAYNPLAGGLLTGKYSLAEVDKRGRLTIDEKYNKRYLSHYNLTVVEKIRELTRQFGRSMVESSLCWVDQCDAIESLILGVSSLKQYRENMSALNGEPLSNSEFEKISELSEYYFQRGFNYYR